MVARRIGMIRFGLGLSFVACAIVGCGMVPVSIPAVDEVDRIIVKSTDWHRYFDDDKPFDVEKPVLTRSINDRDRIAQVVAFLAAHRRGWHLMMDTPPISTHYVSLERDQCVVFSFWLDRSCMGSYWEHDYKQREIDANDMNRIYELLDIKDSDD